MTVEVLCLETKSQKNNDTTNYLLVVDKFEEGGDITGYDITTALLEDIKADSEKGFNRHQGRSFAWGIVQAWAAGQLYLSTKRDMTSEEIDDDKARVAFPGYWRTVKGERIKTLKNRWVDPS